MSGVPIYQPAIRVSLQKTIGRATLDGKVPMSERYGKARRTIDLAPYLGEAGGVTIKKSVREPAGNFTLVLASRLIDSLGDSLYGFIEPMDLIEIRLSHTPHQYAATDLPVIMRGFVSSIQRTETVSNNGAPQRSITVIGQDYGKIWQILQVHYLPGRDPTGSALLEYFKFFAQSGMARNAVPSTQFVKAVVDQIINQYLANLRQASTVAGQASPVLDLTVLDADLQVEDGAVNPYGLGSWTGGPIYSALRQWGDVGPWNELFVEDRDETVNVVYRANPFLRADGSQINSGQTLATDVPINDDDIMVATLTRSDDGVANIFWVESAPALLVDQGMRKMEAVRGDDSTYYYFSHANCSPGLYGIRRMEVQSFQDSTLLTSNPNGAPAAQVAQANRNTLDWCTQRRKRLIDYNEDNILFESGSFRLRGNEDVRAGRYLVVGRGSLKSRYYVVSVAHEYRPFLGFFTTAGVERGTGFIDRSTSANPYFAELQR